MFRRAADPDDVLAPVRGDEHNRPRRIRGIEFQDLGYLRLHAVCESCLRGVAEKRHGPAAVGDADHGGAARHVYAGCSGVEGEGELLEAAEGIERDV